MWKTLEHHAVTFPPAYVPHGIKLLYDAKPVDLSPEEEEVRLPQPARCACAPLSSHSAAAHPVRVSPRLAGGHLLRGDEGH